jgi:hypothetical protein
MFVFIKIMFIPRNLRPRRLRRCPIRTRLFPDLKNRPKTKNIIIQYLKNAKFCINIWRKTTENIGMQII